MRLGRATIVLSTVFATVALPVSSAAAAGRPGVYTGGISNLSPSSAVLHGGVNPKGQVTSWVFQYGTTRGYGAQTPLVPAGGGTATIKVAQAIGGLQANTTYHFRILATSAAGATLGSDRTFQTPRIPLSLQIAGVPNPVAYGNAFALQGTLSGTGGAGRIVELQFNPFPYVTGFKPLGNPEVTGSTGAFSFPVVGLLENAQLRVVTIGRPFVRSPVLVEGVAVRVSFHAHRVHRHRRGRYYRLYGTVAPAEVGAQVGFQLLRPGLPSVNVGGTFVKFATATVSRFSTIVHVRHRGLYQALVRIADGSHVSVYSVPLRLR